MQQAPHTSKRLRDALAAGGEIRSLGTVPGGYDLLCAVRGGDRQPSIVITAGAHADELGGVYAAIRLAQSLDTPHQTFIIPVRDPFGFHGFRRALAFCIGQPVQVENAADVAALLKNHGEVLYEQGTYLLVKVGEYAVAFDVGVDFPTSSVGRDIEPLLKQRPELIPVLSCCRRVIAPYNLPMPRYGDVYDQACRSMIVTGDGFVGNLNRFFDSADPPVEVGLLRDFVDRVQPGLVLDLHEGYGRGLYFYVAENRPPLVDKIARAMVDAVRARGGPTATREELVPYWGPIAAGRDMVGEGMFLSGPTTASSFGSYWQNKGVPAFTLETGGLSPTHWRADLHEWAARAAIETFATAVASR